MVTKIIRNAMLALALLAGIGVAHGADAIVEPAPAPPPVLPEPPGFWRGFYIGALVGYHYESVDTVPNNGSGASLGGYIGGIYRFDNNITVGVEGDYNAAFGDGISQLAGELAQFGSIRGRAGYAIDRWHIYATGGVAFAKFEPFSGTAGPNVDETGWAAGAGVEYMFTDRISARGEYLYMGFDDTFEQVGAPPGVSTDIQNVRAGVAFHF